MPEGQVDTGRVTHLPQMHRQVPWKFPVRAATTANGTLASAFDNASVIDGVTLATDDRILVKNQTAPEENGLYVVQASGVPLRTYDMDDPDEVPGAVIYVMEGTANAGTIWATVSEPAVLDDDDIDFDQFTGGLADLSGINFLVGTATGLLSAEIAVGTTPGGELGGTWASPTVDTTHSGSSHTGAASAAVTTHEAAGDPHTQYVELADDKSVAIVVDGGGSVPTTGVKAGFKWATAGHIRGLEVYSPKNVAGSAAFDIWTTAYGATPPTVANTIFGGGSTKPNLSSSKMYQAPNLTGVTTAFSAGDVTVINLDSITTLDLVVLVIIFDYT